MKQEEDRVLELEKEIQRLKAEKSVGWVDPEFMNKTSMEKEILNQEIARLGEKSKRLNNQVEDFKKKQTDWEVREGKYNIACKNFKKTITELKKELDSVKAIKETAKTFETFFTESSKLKKDFEEEKKVLYEMVNDLTLENQKLREDRLNMKNNRVTATLATMELFS